MNIEVTPLEFAFLELNRAIFDEQKNSTKETRLNLYNKYDEWVNLLPKEQAEKMRYVPGEAGNRFANLFYELTQTSIKKEG